MFKVVRLVAVEHLQWVLFCEDKKPNIAFINTQGLNRTKGGTSLLSYQTVFPAQTMLKPRSGNDGTTSQSSPGLSHGFYFTPSPHQKPVTSLETQTVTSVNHTTVVSSQTAPPDLNDK